MTSLYEKLSYYKRITTNVGAYVVTFHSIPNNIDKISSARYLDDRCSILFKCRKILAQCILKHNQEVVPGYNSFPYLPRLETKQT